ncbi:type II secretion system F family protein [Brucella ciceri]|uniref:type II secretion system F family protein n=1 Tax=Brucella ciceri TaxID=391287 RepID=UPI000DDAE1DF|nr:MULTISPECIES: type II secretion system F family protein [Brucella/Ochrobactrum group]MBA8844651.1 tight adherence protein B [Ochrobactrum sp. RH1CCR137]MBA8856211.1 tight adherence protein B [Ochrobactrum sp. RH1CCR134]MCH6206198.1 type II secretion system F family protein [Brucella ciceri]
MTGSASIVMFVVLAVIACAALFYALFYEKLGKKDHAARRFETVRNSGSERAITRSERDRNADIQKRRKQLQDNIKDLEARQKQREKNQKYPPLRILLTQAGLTLTLQKFYLYSGAAAFFATFVALLFGAPLLFLPGIAIAGFFGLPRWFVLHRRKQRLKKFLEEFPNALDVIVRATRAGLPLNDGLRLIASEAVEPVKSEFKKVVEAQQIGLSIPEAVGKMPDSMPCPETNFFAIVIQIQAQAGGNLSEALNNLSKVLRDRKKMKAKVNALSMEAKASAVIIGALPFIVMVLVYLTSPLYMTLLFTSSTGHMLLGIAAVLMLTGIFIMKNMINFDM